MGRFLIHLARIGLRFVPVGCYESDGAFCLRFGPAYRLPDVTHLPAADRERRASHVVMRHLAAQLPAHLRGEFTDPTDPKGLPDP